MAARTARKRRRLGRPRNVDRPSGAPSSRERILAAATKLFAERGTAATTMERIADKTGFTVGALYRHFHGKADLLLSVVADALEHIPLFQPAARSGGGVAETIGIYVTPQAEVIRRLAREVHAASRRDPRVRRLLGGFNRRIRAAAAERVAALHADPVGSPELTADLLLVIVLGLVHLDTLAPDRSDRPEFRRVVERAVERILGR